MEGETHGRGGSSKGNGGGRKLRGEWMKTNKSLSVVGKGNGIGHRPGTNGKGSEDGEI